MTLSTLTDTMHMVMEYNWRSGGLLWLILEQSGGQREMFCAGSKHENWLDAEPRDAASDHVFLLYNYAIHLPLHSTALYTTNKILCIVLILWLSSVSSKLEHRLPRPTHNKVQTIVQPEKITSSLRHHYPNTLRPKSAISDFLCAHLHLYPNSTLMLEHLPS